MLLLSCFVMSGVKDDPDQYPFNITLKQILSTLMTNASAYRSIRRQKGDIYVIESEGFSGLRPLMPGQCIK